MNREEIIKELESHLAPMWTKVGENADDKRIELANHLYDLIRTQVLLDVLGARPETCPLCKYFGMRGCGSLFKCRLKSSKKYTRTLQYEIEYATCPLPEAEK